MRNAVYAAIDLTDKGARYRWLWQLQHDFHPQKYFAAGKYFLAIQDEKNHQLVQAWDAHVVSPLSTELEVSRAALMVAVCSDDGQPCLLVCDNTSLCLWSLENGSLKAERDGLQEKPTHLFSSLDGSVAIAQTATTLSVLNLSALETIGSLRLDSLKRFVSPELDLALQPLRTVFHAMNTKKIFFHISSMPHTHLIRWDYTSTSDSSESDARLTVSLLPNSFGNALYSGDGNCVALPLAGGLSSQITTFHTHTGAPIKQGSNSQGHNKLRYKYCHFSDMSGSYLYRVAFAKLLELSQVANGQTVLDIDGIGRVVVRNKALLRDYLHTVAHQSTRLGGDDNVHRAISCQSPSSAAVSVMLPAGYTHAREG